MHIKKHVWSNIYKIFNPISWALIKYRSWIMLKFCNFLSLFSLIEGLLRIKGLKCAIYCASTVKEYLIQILISEKIFNLHLKNNIFLFVHISASFLKFSWKFDFLISKKLGKIIIIIWRINYISLNYNASIKSLVIYIKNEL